MATTEHESAKVANGVVMWDWPIQAQNRLCWCCHNYVGLLRLTPHKCFVTFILGKQNKSKDGARDTKDYVHSKPKYIRSQTLVLTSCGQAK